MVLPLKVHTGANDMPMREECKHFQSRTYSDGEVARFCELDLAPEAPWRCPANCPRYERRTADAGWVHGSLVSPPVESEPEMPGEDVGRLLDEAENVVNAVVGDAIAEAEHERARQGRQRWWERFRRPR